MTSETKFLLRTKIVRSLGAPRPVATVHTPNLPPDPVQLSIAETPDGNIFLFFEDADGISIFDSWHETVEDAKDAAERGYAIAGWSPV